MLINCNGVKLYCEVAGAGKPLILLHGNGEDHHIFDGLIPALAQEHRVYALDSRGHGKSGRVAEYHYADMADDLLAFIEAIGQSVDVVGFSDGAIMALLAAIKRPAAVKRMALLGVNLKPGDFTDEGLEWARRGWQETGNDLYRLMLEEPCIELEALLGVYTPTLLVAGEHDIFRPGLYTEMAGALPCAQYERLPGHGHDTYLTAESPLLGLLERFLR